MLIGKDLKEQRIYLGLSQADIAEQAGVTRQSIISLEQKDCIKFTQILDAYGLVVVPAENVQDSIKTLKDKIIDCVKSDFGNNCKVSVCIELCGEEEEC